MAQEELQSKKLAPEEILISWEAPEFVHHERDVKWYILAVLGVVFMIGFSLYTKDWFFLFILPFIIAGTVVYLKTPPKLRTYSISRLGVRVDDRFYSFDNLHSFWVIYNDQVRRLYILQNKKLTQPLFVELDDQDPVLIKNILKRFLHEEEKRDENYAEKLSRILKF